MKLWHLQQRNIATRLPPLPRMAPDLVHQPKCLSSNVLTTQAMTVPLDIHVGLKPVFE